MKWGRVCVMATYQAGVTKAKVTSIKVLEMIELALVGGRRSVLPVTSLSASLLSCLTCFSHPLCSLVTGGCSGTCRESWFLHVYLHDFIPGVLPSAVAVNIPNTRQVLSCFTRLLAGRGLFAVWAKGTTRAPVTWWHTSRALSSPSSVCQRVALKRWRAGWGEGGHSSFPSTASVMTRATRWQWKPGTVNSCLKVLCVQVSWFLVHLTAFFKDLMWIPKKPNKACIKCVSDTYMDFEKIKQLYCSMDILFCLIFWIMKQLCNKDWCFY